MTRAIFRILNNGTLRKSTGSGQQFKKGKKKKNREVLVGKNWFAFSTIHYKWASLLANDVARINNTIWRQLF